MAASTGDEDVELLAEDVLPKRRCVESVTTSLSLSPQSHHGQVSLRVSQPWSWSLCGQLARLCSSLQARSSSYQRWRQGWRETFKPATHMLGRVVVKSLGRVLAKGDRLGPYARTVRRALAGGLGRVMLLCARVRMKG